MKLNFKSNTLGMLRKILAGQVFNGDNVFITEFLQNTQRSGAKKVEINISDDTLVFADNGCGMGDVNSLMTFNLSDWESTNEGFGMGFWSCLAIPYIEKIEVNSKRHKIIINVDSIREVILDESKESTLDDIMDYITYSKRDSLLKGFSVTLVSNYFMDNLYSISDLIRKEGSLMPFKILLNDIELPKKDLFEDVHGQFVKDYSNKYFDARLSIDKYAYANPEAFYELRYVDDIYPIKFCSGVISLKKGAVSLQMPDRKSIVRNDAYFALLDKIKECCADLYKSFLTQANDNDLKVYESGILNYLTSSQFEKFLHIDESMLKRFDSSDDIKEANAKNTDVNNEENEVAVDVSDSNNSSDDNNIMTSCEVNQSSSETKSFEQISILDMPISRDDEFITQIETLERKEVRRLKSKNSIKHFLKNNKALVWVTQDEMYDYSDAIALAEYNSIDVFISKNDLYSAILSENSIPHISELSSSIRNDYSYKNFGFKTKKEQVFVSLLGHIVNEFKLPKAIFQIADIESRTVVEYNDRVLMNKLTKNTRNDIGIFAVCKGFEIILDRKAMMLHKFNLSADRLNNPGKHEFMAVMSNLNTIAHELAHYLYGTVDNTLDHYKMQEHIEERISNLYASLLMKS